MTDKPAPVLRFAPSPNGELHLGHAYSAAFAHGMARRLGGRFLVRIEDIDPARCRDEYAAQILDDLAWLGLEWDGPVMRQSGNLSDYRAAAMRLEAMGLLYPCFATRREIAGATGPAAPCDPDGAALYPGLHRDLPADEIAARKRRGEPFALRLDMAKACDAARGMAEEWPLSFVEQGEGGADRVVTATPEAWGDAVIVRKDAPASYHLAVVVDDARQGVTHVTRGFDLFAATSLHRLLQTLLGFPAPVYAHHRLVEVSGRKLSKSARDASLRSWRESGATPGAVLKAARDSVA